MVSLLKSNDVLALFPAGLGKSLILSHPLLLQLTFERKRKHTALIVFSFPCLEDAIISSGRCRHPYPVHADRLIFDNSLSVASAGFVVRTFRLLMS